MLGIERDGMESTKQLNCSSKRFFEEKGKRALIPLLHTSQCCHRESLKTVDSLLGPSFQNTPSQ